MKILLPETELQGFAGSGEQRERAAERLEGRNPTAGMCRFCSPKRSCKGLRVAGSKEREPPGGREGEIRRRECEDFAPRNGAARVCGEGGAKRGRHRAPGRFKSGGGNVKILLPGTELQGFAGSGDKERAPPGGREVEIRRRECEDFAPQNGAARVCG